MAPKRQAPPPPPPPAASDDETASGSGSEEESEEEEEIAHSPPSATTPKPRAPPPQKGQESEGSDDEEEDGEEEEEEEEDKTNHVAPPPATKNPSPPPPPNREESESSGDEEGEETDDEAPHPKPAPNQEAEEGKGAKPSASEDKQQPGAPFQRTWSTDDEVRILEALAAHRREHGTLPQMDALAASLAGSLDYRGCSSSVLQGKVRTLRRRYVVAGKKRELPSKDHDRRLFDLSKIVWPPTAANDGARREVGEVCERYPYLAEEVRAVEKAYPGLFKREFEMMDDDKACALDEKIEAEAASGEAASEAQRPDQGSDQDAHRSDRLMGWTAHSCLWPLK